MKKDDDDEIKILDQEIKEIELQQQQKITEAIKNTPEFNSKGDYTVKGEVQIQDGQGQTVKYNGMGKYVDKYVKAWCKVRKNEYHNILKKTKILLDLPEPFYQELTDSKVSFPSMSVGYSKSKPIFHKAKFDEKGNLVEGYHFIWDPNPPQRLTLGDIFSGPHYQFWRKRYTKENLPNPNPNNYEAGDYIQPYDYKVDQILVKPEIQQKFAPERWKELGFKSQKEYQDLLREPYMGALGDKVLHFTTVPVEFELKKENPKEYVPAGGKQVSILSIAGNEFRGQEQHQFLTNEEIIESSYRGTMNILRAAKKMRKEVVCLTPVGQGVFLTGDKTRNKEIKINIHIGIMQALNEFKEGEISVVTNAITCNEIDLLKKIEPYNSNVHVYYSEGVDLMQFAINLGEIAVLINAGDGSSLYKMLGEIGQCYDAHNLQQIEKDKGAVTTEESYTLRAPPFTGTGPLTLKALRYVNSKTNLLQKATVRLEPIKEEEEIKPSQEEAKPPMQPVIKKPVIKKMTEEEKKNQERIQRQFKFIEMNKKDLQFNLDPEEREDDYKIKQWKKTITFYTGFGVGSDGFNKHFNEVFQTKRDGKGNFTGHDFDADALVQISQQYPDSEYNQKREKLNIPEYEQIKCKGVLNWEGEKGKQEQQVCGGSVINQIMNVFDADDRYKQFKIAHFCYPNFDGFKNIRWIFSDPENEYIKEIRAFMYRQFYGILKGGKIETLLLIMPDSFLTGNSEVDQLIIDMIYDVANEAVSKLEGEGIQKSIMFTGQNGKKNRGYTPKEPKPKSQNLKYIQGLDMIKVAKASWPNVACGNNGVQSFLRYNDKNELCGHNCGVHTNNAFEEYLARKLKFQTLTQIKKGKESTIVYDKSGYNERLKGKTMSRMKFDSFLVDNAKIDNNDQAFGELNEEELRAARIQKINGECPYLANPQGGGMMLYGKKQGSGKIQYPIYKRRDGTYEQSKDLKTLKLDLEYLESIVSEGEARNLQEELDLQDKIKFKENQYKKDAESELALKKINNKSAEDMAKAFMSFAEEYNLQGEDAADGFFKYFGINVNDIYIEGSDDFELQDKFFLLGLQGAKITNKEIMERYLKYAAGSLVIGETKGGHDGNLVLFEKQFCKEELVPLITQKGISHKNHVYGVINVALKDENTVKFNLDTFYNIYKKEDFYQKGDDKALFLPNKLQQDVTSCSIRSDYNLVIVRFFLEDLLKVNPGLTADLLNQYWENFSTKFCKNFNFQKMIEVITKLQYITFFCNNNKGGKTSEIKGALENEQRRIIQNELDRLMGKEVKKENRKGFFDQIIGKPKPFAVEEVKNPVGLQDQGLKDQRKLKPKPVDQSQMQQKEEQKAKNQLGKTFYKQNQEIAQQKANLPQMGKQLPGFGQFNQLPQMQKQLPGIVQLQQQSQMRMTNRGQFPQQNGQFPQMPKQLPGFGQFNQLPQIQHAERDQANAVLQQFRQQQQEERDQANAVLQQFRHENVYQQKANQQQGFGQPLQKQQSQMGMRNQFPGK